MKKILKIAGAVLGVFILLIIAIGVFYNPDKSLTLSSPKDGEELAVDHVLVEGKYTGSGGQILVNGEEANKDTGKQTFSKDIKLNDGENVIKVEYKNGDKAALTQQIKVNFDLEGMLYLQKEKELSKVPQYELVRREKVDGGFSAIVYTDIVQDGDYLISNLAKEVRDKNQSEKVISILIFSKEDKSEVEKALESTDQKAGLEAISSKVKASYDKRDAQESLFKYPSGLTGDKLALEIGN